MNTTISKVQSYIENKYGKKVRFQTIAASFDADNRKYRTNEKGDLIFDIKSEESFLAQVSVASGGSLNTEEKNELVEIIQMLTEPIFKKFALQNKEMSFVETKVTSISQNKDKVISIVPERKNTVLVLQCENQSLVHKCALQIHESAHRWAFVNYSDIASQVNSAEELEELGAMTIYVQDILGLSPSEVKIISEYSLKTSKDDSPIVILGTTKSVLSLSGLFSNDVLESLFEMTFKVDRYPLAAAQLYQILSQLL